MSISQSLLEKFSNLRLFCLDFLEYNQSQRCLLGHQVLFFLKKFKTFLSSFSLVISTLKNLVNMLFFGFFISIINTFAPSFKNALTN